MFHINMYFFVAKHSSGFYNFAFKFYLAPSNACNTHLAVISQHTKKIISNTMKFYEYLNLAIKKVDICFVDM